MEETNGTKTEDATPSSGEMVDNTLILSSASQTSTNFVQTKSEISVETPESSGQKSLESNLDMKPEPTEKPKKPVLKVELNKGTDPDWLLVKPQLSSIRRLILLWKQKLLSKEQKVLFKKVKYLDYKPLIEESEDFKNIFTNYSETSREEPVLQIIEGILTGVHYPSDGSRESKNDNAIVLSLLKATFCKGSRPEDGFVLDMKSFEAFCAGNIHFDNCLPSQRLIVEEDVDTKGLPSIYELVFKHSARQQEKVAKERAEAKQFHFRTPLVDKFLGPLYSQHDPCIVFDMCDKMKSTGDLCKSEDFRIRTVALALLESIFYQPEAEHMFVLSHKLLKKKIAKLNEENGMENGATATNRRRARRSEVTTYARRPEDDIPGTSSQYEPYAKKRRTSSQETSINPEPDYDTDSSFLTRDQEGPSTSQNVVVPDHSLGYMDADFDKTTLYNDTSSANIDTTEQKQETFQNGSSAFLVSETGMIEKDWISVYDLIFSIPQTKQETMMRDKAIKLDFKLQSQVIQKIFAHESKSESKYLVVLDLIKIAQSGKQQEHSLGIARLPKATKHAVSLMKSTFCQGSEPDSNFVLLQQLFASSFQNNIESLLQSFSKIE